MAYPPLFPGQYGRAGGGTIISPDRLQTSQSGGSYIGPMAAQLPTQDMSFMWSGNGATSGMSDPSTGGAPMAPGGGYASIPGMSSPGSPAVGSAGGWSQSMLPQAGGGASTPGITSTPYAGGVPPSAGYGDPYLSGRADDITRRTTDMLGDAFAGIQGNAVGAGGLGGSRQAVAQGQAGAKAADYMAGQLANMYSGDWNQSQNRGLQKYNMDQNFSLGNKNADYGFFSNNRSLDQGDFQNGLRAYGLGADGDWSALTSANGIFSPWSSYGTSTNSGQTGGGWQGALGGLLGGAQVADQWGWFK
jgi:hypothetical protein